MNKSYWIVPLIGLLIFAAVNSQFREAYNEREQQAKVAAQQAREAELEAQRKAREAAMQEALEAQAQRKAEREEREAEKQREQEERRAAIAKRDEAFRDQERYAREAKTLRAQIEAVKEELRLALEQKQSLTAELVFAGEVAQKAEANTAELFATLDAFAAEKAARDAAQAAAAKKK